MKIGASAGVAAPPVAVTIAPAKDPIPIMAATLPAAFHASSEPGTFMMIRRQHPGGRGGRQPLAAMISWQFEYARQKSAISSACRPPPAGGGTFLSQPMCEAKVF